VDLSRLTSGLRKGVVTEPRTGVTLDAHTISICNSSCVVTGLRSDGKKKTINFCIKPAILPRDAGARSFIKNFHVPSTLFL